MEKEWIIYNFIVLFVLTLIVVSIVSSETGPQH